MSRNIKPIALTTMVIGSLAASFVPAHAEDIVPASSDATDTCITSETGIGVGCADFADEFNGTELNPNIWTEKTGADKQDPYGHYTADATEVSDGTLKINTQWGNLDANGQPIADNSGQSAQITTRDKASFEYGVWEAKMWDIANSSNDNTSNGHMGLYLYGDPTDPKDTRQQIEPDLRESFGDVIPGSGRVTDGTLDSFQPENKVQTVIHYPQTFVDQQTADGVPANQVKKKSGVTTSTYVPGTPIVVTAEKDETGFYIYHNGALINSISATDPNYASIFPEGMPMGTILTARVSNLYWGVQAHENGGIVVDYVRHWALPSGDTVETPPVEVTVPTEPTAPVETPTPVDPTNPATPEPTDPATSEPTAPVTEEPSSPATPEPSDSETPAPVDSEEPTPVESPNEPTAPATEDPSAKPVDSTVTPAPAETEEPTPVETSAEPLTPVETSAPAETTEEATPVESETSAEVELSTSVEEPTETVAPAPAKTVKPVEDSVKSEDKQSPVTLRESTEGFEPMGDAEKLAPAVSTDTKDATPSAMAQVAETTATVAPVAHVVDNTSAAQIADNAMPKNEVNVVDEQNDAVSQPEHLAHTGINATAVLIGASALLLLGTLAVVSQRRRANG